MQLRMLFAAYSARRWYYLPAICVVLTACSHAPSMHTGSSAKQGTTTEKPAGNANGKRYIGKDKDWGPTTEIDMSHIPNAQPRYELRTIAGNKNPYTVLGKTYSLIDDERAYKERGKASWYGYKFNGEHTSNGELYDMFSMTAAHKTLPIPSYVKVTNLDNHSSVIARVNDRGPFHEDRIIDLSYAAAQRLGITQKGTGNVEVEIMVPEGDPRPPLRARKTAMSKNDYSASKISVKTTKPTIITNTSVITDLPNGANLPDGTYLQIAAFSVEPSAKQFAANISSKLTFPAAVNMVKKPQMLYRVHVGPFKSTQALQAARELLQKINISQAHVVYL